jgi:hypothetical protein
MRRRSEMREQRRPVGVARFLSHEAVESGVCRLRCKAFVHAGRGRGNCRLLVRRETGDLLGHRKGAELAGGENPEERLSCIGGSEELADVGEPQERHALREICAPCSRVPPGEGENAQMHDGVERVGEARVG